MLPRKDQTQMQRVALIKFDFGGLGGEAPAIHTALNGAVGQGPKSWAGGGEFFRADRTVPILIDGNDRLDLAAGKGQMRRYPPDRDFNLNGAQSGIVGTHRPGARKTGEPTQNHNADQYSQLIHIVN